MSDYIDIKGAGLSSEMSQNRPDRVPQLAEHWVRRFDSRRDLQSITTNIIFT